MDSEAVRGVIRNTEQAKRINDFSGLRFGKITPTDIDGFIDFQNKAFVLIETKYTGGHMPFGQRLAIERLIDIIDETGRKGLALVAEYGNELGDIDCAKAVVTEYRYRGEWKIPRIPLNVKDAIDRFLKEVNK
jgi:hypothetical protein